MRHPAQESDQIPGRGVLGVVLGVVLTTAVAVVIAYSIARTRVASLGRMWRPPGPPIPTDVNQIETRPFSVQAQGLEGHVRATRYLGTYGWINPERRLVHIPISVAMRLYLERRASGLGPRASGRQGAGGER